MTTTVGSADVPCRVLCGGHSTYARAGHVHDTPVDVVPRGWVHRVRVCLPCRCVQRCVTPTPPWTSTCTEPSFVHARDRPGSSDGTSEIGVRVQEVPWPARHASGHPNTYASTATALRHRRMRHGAVKPRFVGVVATRAFCFSAHMSRERVMLSRDTVVWRACGLLLAVELERDRINKDVHVSK